MLRRQDSYFLETVSWFIMCCLLISSIPYTLEKVQTDYPWAWGAVREKSLLLWCNNKTLMIFSLLDFSHEAYGLALAFLAVWSFSWFTSILIDLELISIWRLYFSLCKKKSDRVLIREFAPLAQDHVFPRMCSPFRHACSWKTVLCNCFGRFWRTAFNKWKKCSSSHILIQWKRKYNYSNFLWASCILLSYVKSRLTFMIWENSRVSLW